MIHPGERAVQRRAGLPGDDRGSVAVGGSIPAVAAEFLRQQRLLVVGAVADEGGAWASLLTGPPGFVQPLDDGSLIVRALPGRGDPLDGWFDRDREIGMIALEPSTRRRIRVNGTARAVDLGLLVRTEQVFGNCPKYLQARRLLPGPDGREGPAGTPTRTVSTSAVLTGEQRRWIAAADTFFVTTHAAGYGGDVSHGGGNPGFVQVTRPDRLVWPDYLGNSMYMTLGNLALDPSCGLLLVDWERGDTLALSGRARVDWDPDLAAAVPGRSGWSSSTSNGSCTPSMPRRFGGRWTPTTGSTRRCPARSAGPAGPASPGSGEAGRCVRRVGCLP